MTYMDREDVTICAALIIDGILKVIIVIMILPCNDPRCFFIGYDGVLRVSLSQSQIQGWRREMVKRSKLFDWAGQQGSFAQHRGHEFVDQRIGCRSLVQGFQVGAQQVLLVGEDGVMNLPSRLF